MNKPAVPSIPADTTPDQPLHILCVDDEENILKALRRLFRGEPFRVLMATTGAEGLSLLQSTGNIGLILSDQRMPDMSGLAFLTAAKALAPEIPRIILTGYTERNAVEEAAREGVALRVLPKPWDDRELLQVVRDGLSGTLRPAAPS